MTFDLTKVFGIGAVIATLAAAPVMAQEIGDWDGDTDGTLNQDEFNQGWSENFGDGDSPFDAWDENGDGMLGEDEYNAGVFNSYDSDRNGTIDETEFGDVGDDLGDGGFWNT